MMQCLHPPGDFCMTSRNLLGIGDVHRQDRHCLTVLAPKLTQTVCFRGMTTGCEDAVSALKILGHESQPNSAVCACNKHIVQDQAPMLKKWLTLVPAPFPSSSNRQGARLRHRTRRDGCKEHVPMNVPPGRRRARSIKRRVENLHFGDLRKAPPAPPHGSRGPALATNLIEEEADNAVDDPIVVRFRDPTTPVQSEADEPLVGDGSEQLLIDSRYFWLDHRNRRRKPETSFRRKRYS